MMLRAAALLLLLITSPLPASPAPAGARDGLLSGVGCVENPRTAAGRLAQSPVRLTVEYAENPLGLDERSPRFGWQFSAFGSSILQSAYQIRVTLSEEDLTAETAAFWDTGKVLSSQSTHVAYGGPPLQSRTRYHWTVRVWDQEDSASDWSQSAWWETGLLVQEDWTGAWIGGRQERDHDWADFRAEFEFTLLEPPVRFLFRAQPIGKTYGETYLWELDVDRGRPVLRALARHYPGGSSSQTTVDVLKEILLPNMTADELVGRSHLLVVEARGSEITTWMDGVQVDRLEDERHTSGTVGFEAASSEAALIHRVTVEADGAAVFETDFSKGANPFTAGRPTPSGLLISGGADGKDAVLAITTPAPLLRKSFEVRENIERARLYVAAGGWPAITLNGQPVNEAIETGFTAYDKRVLYRTYDVSDLVAGGPNVLGAELGRGWYGVTVPNEWYWHQAAWHGNPALKLQLEITYEDGSREVIVTDDTWRTGDGPTTDDSIYTGERFDARRRIPGWDQAGFDDGSWQAVTLVDGPAGNIVAAALEPIRVVASLPPASFSEPVPGTFVFDFGRIFSGWVRLAVTGEAGQTVSMIHGEKLNEDGTVQVISGLVDAQLQTDYYTLSGEGPEVWEPKFGYKGFRYVQLEGFPGRPTQGALTLQLVHSSVESVGYFASSNDLLNMIHEAGLATIINNLHGFVTDTPTFEKNGWTGDAHASSYAAGMSFALQRIWTKWMADFRDAQAETGEIPEIVPTTEYYGYENTPGWRMVWGPVPSWDAATFVIPEDMVRLYGDTRIREEMWETQKRLVDYTGTFINESNGFTYGNPNNPFLGEYAGQGPVGPVDATAVAYYYHMVRTLAANARLLGHSADAATYGALADRIREAYNARYWDDGRFFYRTMGRDGTAEPYAQTQNVLPVAFGLAPEGSEAAIMARLNEDIVSRDYHLSAGVFAIRYLMTLLSDFGYTETAYRVATRTAEPSWGWWIENGHGTMMEGWSLNSRSRSHHYFGSISSWMLESVAGIRPLEDGYARVRIQPRLPEAMAWVRSSVQTIRGQVESWWINQGEGRIEFAVIIPGNTTGEVWVPSAAARATEEPTGAEFLRSEDGYAVYAVGPGRHLFRSER